MLRWFFLLSLISSSLAIAAPEDHVISLKERIRLSLWVEGLEHKELKSQAQPSSRPFQLPEELERPLRKM